MGAKEKGWSGKIVCLRPWYPVLYIDISFCQLHCLLSLPSFGCLNYWQRWVVSPTILLGRLEVINLWKVKPVHCLSCKSRSGWGLQPGDKASPAALLPSLSLLFPLLTYSSAGSASWTPLNLLCRQGVNRAQTHLGICNCTETPACQRGRNVSGAVWS